MSNRLRKLIELIKSIYPGLKMIPLHAPVFEGNEQKYVLDCFNSTFVSYIGEYVERFERMTAAFTGAKYAVAMVNGTTALQIALRLAGVRNGDEVITQALTFVATANAIVHAGAVPVFVDVDRDTMGMSPASLEAWLQENVLLDSGTNTAINRMTKKVVSAIVPMHTFGHPCRIDEVCEVAAKYSIPVIEDSAESLGSHYKGQHTGTFGLAGILSYNGNKTITTGGGGMIITDDPDLAIRAKHITTTAKTPHAWDFVHDEIGYNYRMPNINAAIGCAQMEQLVEILENKKETASKYSNYFRSIPGVDYFDEPKNANSNYWLNAIVFPDNSERNLFLRYSNKCGVMARPAWHLMSDLEMFEKCQSDDLKESKWLAGRVVNLPSGVRLKD